MIDAAADPLWQLDAVSLAPARLRDVTLAIPHGVTAVVGWSGAGKTSLLNLLAGFVQPDRGKIAGEPRVAWVPQNGGLWPQCGTREHLEIAGASEETCDALLASFDLSEKVRAFPHELSEGEQSRLAVARALAANATVLVMDEPLVHVDPARAGNYWRKIRDHVSLTGASLVFSTHEPEAALSEAAHVICLREGRVLHAGGTFALYDNPPTPEAMDCLGAGNWFTPDEAKRWLGVEFADERCLRPERVGIESSERDGFTVESARFCGSIAEVTLRDDRTGTSRMFFHRPIAALRPGARAIIRLLE